MNCAFNIKELEAAMCKDAAWLTPVLLRRSQLDEMDGGWSAVLRLIIRTMLVDRAGFSHAGVPIVTETKQFLLYAKLTNILADGDGVRLGYSIKGGGCLKACATCNRTLSKNSGLAHRMGDL